GFRQPGDRGGGGAQGVPAKRVVGPGPGGNRGTQSACADSGVDEGRLSVFVAVTSVARRNSPAVPSRPLRPDMQASRYHWRMLGPAQRRPLSEPAKAGFVMADPHFNGGLP